MISWSSVSASSNSDREDAQSLMSPQNLLCEQQQGTRIWAASIWEFTCFNILNTCFGADSIYFAAALQGPNALLSIQHLIQHTRAKSAELPKEPAESAAPHRSVLDFIAADNADDETSEDEEAEQQAEAMMGLALAPADAIDWDGPMATGTLQGEADGEILRLWSSMWWQSRRQIIPLVDLPLSSVDSALMNAKHN